MEHPTYQDSSFMLAPQFVLFSCLEEYQLYQARFFDVVRENNFLKEQGQKLENEI